MKKIRVIQLLYELFLLGIFLHILMMLLLVNAGCRKESWIQPIHMLDTSFYLILNMNGKTYNSAAWKNQNSTYEYAPSIHGIFSIKADSTGAPLNWDLSINAEAELISRSLQGNTITLVQPSTFSANISIHKKGELFGQYNVSLINSYYDNSFSNVDGKSYGIDTTSSHVTITGMSPPATPIPYIDGNFDCTVYEMRNYYAKPIHAYGSFRLKAF
jgi:hypothetical protein